MDKIVEYATKHPIATLFHVWTAVSLVNNIAYSVSKKVNK